MENKPQVKIVKFLRFGLSKLLDTETGEYAVLRITIRMGYPRFIVYTSNFPRRPNAEDRPFNYNTMIVAPFNYIDFSTLFDVAKDIIDGKKERKKTIECLNVKYKDGEKTDEIYVQARVTIGKDKDGVIYIAVTEEGKRKVKFDITTNTKWFRRYDENGNLIQDKGELSCLYAKAYFRKLEKVMDEELLSDTLEISHIDAPNTKPKTPVKNTDNKNTETQPKEEEKSSKKIDEAVKSLEELFG